MEITMYVTRIKRSELPNPFKDAVRFVTSLPEGEVCSWFLLAALFDDESNTFPLRFVRAMRSIRGRAAYYIRWNPNLTSLMLGRDDETLLEREFPEMYDALVKRLQNYPLAPDVIEQCSQRLVFDEKGNLYIGSPASTFDEF